MNRRKNIFSLIAAALLLTVIYLVFMKRYYHLHEAYLMSLEGKEAGNGK